MTVVGAGPVTAARMVEALEELEAAGQLDTLVVEHVRQGLLAVADEVRLAAGHADGGIEYADPHIALSAVLALIDPDAR